MGGRIPVLALGTYIAAHSPWENECTNVWEMRSLVWWAKNDPTKTNRPKLVTWPNGSSCMIRILQRRLRLRSDTGINLCEVDAR